MIRTGDGMRYQSSGYRRGKGLIDWAMRNSNTRSFGNEEAPDKKVKKERAVIAERMAEY